MTTTTTQLAERQASAAGPRPVLRPSLDLWALMAVIAAALMATAFFLPLWEMDLAAPQYPGGLELTAYGTTMKGDLQEINALNHYAGVNMIDPDDVLEFALFPFLLSGVIALVLVAAFLGRPRLRWLAAVAAWGFALGFLVTSRFWLYRFGHDLNEEAPLYPGPFTPRVLGHSRVVNFETDCMVTWGWWLVLLAAIILTFGGPLVRFIRQSWQNTGAAGATVAAAALLALIAVPGGAGGSREARAAGDLATMVRDAAPGATLLVTAGTYTGPVVIDKPLTLVGLDWPVIDGQGKGHVVEITAPDVTLRGFVIQSSGREVSDEPSGIRVTGDRATIEGNRLHDVLYGIALFESDGHVVRGNAIESYRDFPAERRGHGLYLYYTNDNILEENVVSYAKDGIYINFSARNTIARNTVTDLRYGIHFMYADASTMTGNVFRDNLTGASIMYSDDLLFEGNEFGYNRSYASGYGLLFKDVDNVELRGNSIHHNTIALTMEGAPITPGKFLIVRDNLVGYNQVALYLSTTVGAKFSGNTFVGNLRQVDARGGSLEHHNAWEIDGRGNYWDDYRGYDANGDGSGDIPYHYRAAYGELVQKDESLKAFAHTPAQMAIDLAARWFPVYREPASVIDNHPLMRPPMHLGETAQAGGRWMSTTLLAALTILPALALALPARARRNW